MGAMTGVLMALVLMVAVGAGGLYIWKNLPNVQETSLPGVPDSSTSITKQDYLCGQTPTVSGRFRAIDTEQSTNHYINSVQGYFVPQGKVQGTAIVPVTGGASGALFSASAVTLTCGETYDFYAVDSANAYSGGVVKDLKAGVAPVDVTVKIYNSSALQARVKDRVADGYWRIAGGDGSYTGLAATFANSSAGATLDAGTGGCHDLSISLRTTNQDTAFGTGNNDVIIAVDAGPTVWNQPSTSLGNNIKDGSNFDSYDLTALSGYEYVYAYKKIQRTGGSFDFMICGVAGVDPGATDNVLIRAVAKGYALDGKDNNAVRYAYFGNDASYTELVGTTEEITIDEVA